ncbi:MAG: phosphoribosyl-ATP diphosphatase [Desulfurococcales archaeon]|nr:phosphoribosyl-ATP diphosphatase [Desulfurococcales archaeon]
MGFSVLDEVYSIILDRLESKPQGSYTWETASRGVDHVARKVGEEAVELVVEAVKGDRDRIAEEAADLLYHLLLLLAVTGVTPDMVEEVLRGRMK